MAKKEPKIEFEELKKPKSDGKIGEVFHADTEKGISLKILENPDNLKLGQPIIVDTPKYLYYCMLGRLYYPGNETVMKFANTSLTNLIPSSQIEGVRGKEFYGLADLSCLKILPVESVGKKDPGEFREFDTIPPVFTNCRAVTEDEIKTIYRESETTDSIGTLRGFDYEIPIDFATLVKKPYGVFGRTGIGKSILNKLLCLSILKQKVSRLLIFDMQGEYGVSSRADGSKGLKHYFTNEIQIYRLDAKKVIDGAEPFTFYRENITPGDLIASSQTLSEPAKNALRILNTERTSQSGSSRQDLLYFIENYADTSNEAIHAGSLNAIKNRISRFNDYSFLIPAVPNKKDSIENMFENLKQGKSIVIDFGKYGVDKFLYYFIANAITRRLYGTYSRKEAKNEKDLPPLVVVLEEAHKFLQPSIIHHTIFDRIAREMRKFQLTLAFVDQRPSQIDEEVMSQVANRFIMHLTDKRDMDTTVGTLTDPAQYRRIISGLLKRECLVYGDAISVPTIIHIKNYHDEKGIKKSLGMIKTQAEVNKDLSKGDMTKLFAKKE
ncbi:MAG: ATP-binding protein [Promethearchaeota archaeon]